MVELKRGIDAATLEAMAGHFHPVVAVYLDWPGGAVRAHSGSGQITHNGEVYTGVGGFADINIPGDLYGAVPSDTVLTLVDVPSSIFDRLEDDIRDRDAVISFGVTTVTGGSELIGDLNILYEGVMDATQYIGGRETDTISHGIQLTIGGASSMRSSADFTHSYENQIDAVPGDTAGRHLQYATTQARRRKWPQ